MRADSVDRHIAQWSSEIPDLDPVDEGVITRMQMLVKHLKRQKQATIESYDLGLDEYETLHMLAGCGPEHRATPTEIATWLQMSPAAITARIDALERRRLVRRLPSPDDRRSVIVERTAAGRRVWRAACADQTAHQTELLDPLNAREREQLANLLRRMLHVVDRPDLLTMPSEVLRRTPESRRTKPGR
jgi:DNA-binding MarR family transcriptional regulator